MSNQGLEPFIRMAIGHIYNAQLYLARLPDMEENASLHRVSKDLTDSIGRLQHYARKSGIDLRESMKT